jgi:hypothetical protein
MEPYPAVKSGTLTIYLLYCLFAAVPLYSRARVQEERPLVNTEYLLCITAFDVSELPQSQQAMGPILQNRFVKRLGGVNHRARTEQELTLYEQIAWDLLRKDAAQKLTAKRAERDDLLYRGFPDWKYKKELKRVDGEIKGLESDLEKAGRIRPRVEGFPVFKLMETFPASPETGGEEVFLETKKADAFIQAKLSVYYQRIHVMIKLYTRFGSYLYEDETFFSPEDLGEAANELAVRLEAAVSGTERSFFTIRAEPENAQVLVNGNLAEKDGELVLNPGPVFVSAAAEGYETLTGKLELAPGEHASSEIVLDPLVMEQLTFSLPGRSARVYIGALYAGTLSPSGDLELSIPNGLYRYLNVETDEGHTGQVVVMGDERPGREDRIVTVNPRLPPPSSEKPVEKRRRQFYGAWGRLWVTIPLAFLINGIKESYLFGYRASAASLGPPGSMELYDKASLFNNISIGTWIAVGVFGIESLIRLIVYVNAANREAVPLWKKK